MNILACIKQVPGTPGRVALHRDRNPDAVGQELISQGRTRLYSLEST